MTSALEKGELLVVDFHAAWCGPCHAIAPVLDQLSKKYPQAKFIKVDVDAQRSLAQRFRVTAMPTFVFWKDGGKIDEMKGANPSGLTQLVQRYAGPVRTAAAKPAAAASASGSGTGSSSAPAAAGGPAVEGVQSVLSVLSSKGLTCLNESKDHPLSSIVGSEAGPKGRSYLESDVDPELLIGLQFNEPVKLKAIQIFSGVSPSQAPKTIQLFINHLSLDFNDISSLQPTQEIELSSDDIKGNRLDLRFVRFQNVRSLHIFVKDNQEDEETTRIDSFDLFGSVAESTDKGPLAKPEDGH